MSEPHDGTPSAATLYLSGRTLDDVGTTRDFVRSALRREDPDIVHTAVLLTSELATNALIHADRDADLAPTPTPHLAYPRPFHVTVDACFQEICILVCGKGSRLAVVKPKKDREWDESGRGLALVAALSETWGTHGDAFSRTVWFVLKRTPTPIVA
ncbi:ATP-binding protein [Marinactinospora rubrisoli]|uniref:ATP-binding protein n=1 Tax=Marinactinospora rubrisoli TaxID=2715399 RepID=A0ABW2KK09_9ACTN